MTTRLVLLCNGYVTMEAPSCLKNKVRSSGWSLKSRPASGSSRMDLLGAMKRKKFMPVSCKGHWVPVMSWMNLP